MAKKRKIQIFRGTDAELTAANRILASGEEVYVTDLYTTKVGDGIKTYTQLPFLTVDYSQASPNLR